MSMHNLRKRIERIEQRPANPELVRAAMERWEQAGHVPADPRLREYVERLAAAAGDFDAMHTVVAGNPRAAQRAAEERGSG